MASMHIEGTVKYDRAWLKHTQQLKKFSNIKFASGCGNYSPDLSLKHILFMIFTGNMHCIWHWLVISSYCIKCKLEPECTMYPVGKVPENITCYDMSLLENHNTKMCFAQ